MSTVEKGRHWRDGRDYRADYLRSNPGYFGHVYICSQCLIPLWGKHNVEVDHITPGSVHAKKWTDKKGVEHNTSFTAELLNHRFNLASICSSCNKIKSNRTGHFVVKGYIAKASEVVLLGIQNTVIYGLWGGKVAASFAQRNLLPKSLRPRPSKLKQKVKKPNPTKNPFFTLIAALVFAVLWSGHLLARFVMFVLRGIFKFFTNKNIGWVGKLFVPLAVTAFIIYWLRLL